MQKLINSHNLKLYLLLSYFIKLWFLINPGGSTVELQPQSIFVLEVLYRCLTTLNPTNGSVNQTRTSDI